MTARGFFVVALLTVGCVVAKVEEVERDVVSIRVTDAAGTAIVGTVSIHDGQGHVLVPEHSEDGSEWTLRVERVVCRDRSGGPGGRILETHWPETYTIGVTSPGYTPGAVTVSTEDFAQEGMDWTYRQTIRLSRCPR
jgi:hypothetical protein